MFRICSRCRFVLPIRSPTKLLTHPDSARIVVRFTHIISGDLHRDPRQVIVTTAPFFPYWDTGAAALNPAHVDCDRFFYRDDAGFLGVGRAGLCRGLNVEDKEKGPPRHTAWEERMPIHGAAALRGSVKNRWNPKIRTHPRMDVRVMGVLLVAGAESR